MFISKKIFKKFEERLSLVEERLNSIEKSKTADPVDEISYKEVIDEWLNGKKK